MLKCDFHVHTIFSKHPLLSKFRLIDGLDSPEEMIKQAKIVGLDVIAITDHNVLLGKNKSEYLSKKYEIIVISGVEVSIGKKEYIALGIDKIPSMKSISEISEEVHEQNGILIAPHPFDPFGRGFKDFEYFDAIEVLNGMGGNYNNKIQKNGKAELGCSDSHSKIKLGYVYTEVDSEPNIESIFHAIRKGKTKACGKRIPFKTIVNYYYLKYKTWIYNIFNDKNIG